MGRRAVAWIGRPARTAVQVVGHGFGRSVAPGGVLLQALESDRFQIARDLRIQSAWGHGLLAADLIERFQRRSSLKRRAAGQQLVEDSAQGVDVGGGAKDRRGRPRSAPAPCTRASPTARPGSSTMRPDRPGAGRYRNQRPWETRLSTARPARNRGGCSKVSDRGEAARPRVPRSSPRRPVS